MSRDCPDGGNSSGNYEGGSRPPTDAGEPIIDDKIDKSSKVAVRIRGMPWRTSFEEIQEFFKDHKFIENSIIFGLSADNRKNGYGSILFESE
jgi:RNA recognition motif-containing protein